jgi:hypothetical protein
MWSGLLFLIRNKNEVARQYFNQQNEWTVNQKAPLGLALKRQDLANITWLLPGKNDF